MKSSLYEYLLKEVEKKLNAQDEKDKNTRNEEIKKQNLIVGAFAVFASMIMFFTVLYIMLIIILNLKSNLKFIQYIQNCKYIVNIIIGIGVFGVLVPVLFLMVLVFGRAYIDKRRRSTKTIDKFSGSVAYDKAIDREIHKLFKIMACDKSLYNRLNKILDESPNKNLAMNILISDSKYERKLKGASDVDFLKQICITVIGNLLIIFMTKGIAVPLIEFSYVFFNVVMIFYPVWKIYNTFNINTLDLEKDTLELYIKNYVTGFGYNRNCECYQSIDGTCKLSIVKDGDYVVLTIHAGQLEPGKLVYNINNSDEINKIVVDPGVKAPKDSSELFANFPNVKEIVGLSNLDTSEVTNMNGILFECGVKELNLSDWDTSKVTDMSWLFAHCLNLERINVKGWDTSNVENLSEMFCTCPKLHKLDLSNFKTSNLVMGKKMFDGDVLYDLDIKNLDNSKTGLLMIFDNSLIYKITVGSKFIDVFPTFYGYGTDLPFEEDGITYITTSDKWVALDGPDKGSKKDPYEMKDVTRTQPVTYEVEHMPLENKNYTEDKIITRTINLHLRSAQGWSDTINTSIKQNATVHRQVTTGKNGQKTYGEWSQDYWEEYNAPNTNTGMPKPAKVSKQIVDSNTQNQIVDIYY